MKLRYQAWFSAQAIAAMRVGTSAAVACSRRLGQGSPATAGMAASSAATASSRRRRACIAIASEAAQQAAQQFLALAFLGRGLLAIPVHFPAVHAREVDA